jgi:hypothetical protein
MQKEAIMTYVAIANSESGASARTKINGIGTGLDSHIATTGSDAHGLGTLSTQNANAVAITGGNISGVSASGTFNGTVTGTVVGSISGSSVVTGSAVDAHIALNGISVHGLKTMAIQSASAVSITGGTMSGVAISGITQLLNVRSASATLTLAVTDDVILVSASGIGVNLPTAVGISGAIYHIKNTSSGSIVVYASGSQTIDGDGVVNITTKYASMLIVADGSNWNIL